MLFYLNKEMRRIGYSGFWDYWIVLTKAELATQVNKFLEDFIV